MRRGTDKQSATQGPLSPWRAARGADPGDAQLVEERGAENFTLADACRVAGVTTAAPYRHFRGKQEILEEIASRGFDEMRKRAMAAVAEKGEGTLEGIIAMGQAYVAFAVQETAVFRLMFGQEPSLKKAEHVVGTGHACFAACHRPGRALLQAQQSARRCPGDRIEAVDLRSRRRLAPDRPGLQHRRTRDRRQPAHRQRHTRPAQRVPTILQGLTLPDLALARPEREAQGSPGTGLTNRQCPQVPRVPTRDRQPTRSRQRSAHDAPPVSRERTLSGLIENASDDL